MKDIYGRDIGTRIDLRYGDGDYEARHPWPEETAVSAGTRGLVLGRDGTSYRTAFMEVYPPGASFIRGEGATAAECEDACWAAYQKALTCPSGAGHAWEPRGYRNGAGFCTHCGTFKAKAFTPEELGLHCHACGAATFYSRDGDRMGCEAHPVDPAQEHLSGLELLLHDPAADRSDVDTSATVPAPESA